MKVLQQGFMLLLRHTGGVQSEGTKHDLLEEHLI